MLTEGLSSSTRQREREKFSRLDFATKLFSDFWLQFHAEEAAAGKWEALQVALKEVIDNNTSDRTLFQIYNSNEMDLCHCDHCVVTLPVVAAAVISWFELMFLASTHTSNCPAVPASCLLKRKWWGHSLQPAPSIWQKICKIKNLLSDDLARNHLRRRWLFWFVFAV